MSLRPPLHVSTFHSRTVVSMFGPDVPDEVIQSNRQQKKTGRGRKKNQQQRKSSFATQKVAATEKIHFRNGKKQQPPPAGTVFSRLGRFFPAASKMHFFCCKGAFVLLQGVFSAALNFPAAKRHFLLAFFPAAETAFSRCKAFFSCCQTCFFPFRCFFPAANLCFSRAARRQGARERRVIHWAFATCKLDSAWTNR